MFAGKAKQGWEKRCIISRKSEKSRLAWKSEHNHLLGNEILSEEGTSPNVVSESRESNCFGRDIRYAKQGERDGR